MADSSVAIAWAVPSQANERTDRLLDEISQGAQAVVPVLWFFEVANSLIMLARRGRLTREDCRQARHELGLRLLDVDEEGQNHAFSKVSDLAETHSLSVYDAVYLELALRRRVPLASRDLALNKPKVDDDLYVQIANVQRVFFDELAAALDVLAHER